MSRKSKGAVKHVDELKLVNENSIKKLAADAMKIWESEHLAQITALKAKIEELRSSQEFNSAKYDDLVTECEDLKKVNKLQEQEIMKLKSQSMKLEARGDKEEEKVDAIEQYGRRLNLEISGIPIKDGENTNKIMEEIAKLVNVELSADQISTSHRLAVKPKRTAGTENGIETETPPPHSIIVRFLSRDVRNQVYRNRKLLRNADLKNFSVEGTSKIFINENLTPTRKKLFWKAKQQSKTNNYKFFLTVNGNIFVRKAEETEAVLIKNEHDLRLNEVY